MRSNGTCNRHVNVITLEFYQIAEKQGVSTIINQRNVLKRKCYFSQLNWNYSRMEQKRRKLLH